MTLQPAIVKLHRLQQTAAECFGAARGVVEHRNNLTQQRGPARRELAECMQSSQRNSAAVRARIERLEVKLAYIDAAIEAANARCEELNARASDARGVAGKLDEHLQRTLAAGGFEP